MRLPWSSQMSAEGRGRLVLFLNVALSLRSRSCIISVDSFPVCTFVLLLSPSLLFTRSPAALGVVTLPTGVTLQQDHSSGSTALITSVWGASGALVQVICCEFPTSYDKRFPR